MSYANCVTFFFLFMQLYGYFKQALQNPPFSQVSKPWGYQIEVCLHPCLKNLTSEPIWQLYFSLIQESAKYNAWKKVVDDGLSAADAQKKYIEYVEELKAKYGTQ